MKIHELFTDESKWTQGAMARDSEGYTINPSDKGAVCWCLTGALVKCYRYNNSKYWEIYGKLVSNLHSVAGYNDDEERVFEDIKRLVTSLNI